MVPSETRPLSLTPKPCNINENLSNVGDLMVETSAITRF